MSRLEQMRQHFLQRVYSEQAATVVQNHQKSPARALSSAKSVAHLPLSVGREFHYQNHYQQKISNSQYHSPIRRTPSCMTTTSVSNVRAKVDRRNSSASNCSTSSNLSRVKSLTSIHQQHLELYRPSPPTPAKVSKYNSVQTKVQHQQLAKVNSTSRASNVNKTQPTSQTFSRAFAESNCNSSSPRRPSSTNSNHRSSLSTRNSSEQANSSLQCKHCSRSFAAKERLDKHVTICAKTTAKKRPVFSSAKQRGVNSNDKESDDEESGNDRLEEGTTAPTTTSKNKEKPSKSSWQESRRQLLEAIRKAKQFKEAEPNTEPAKTEEIITTNSTGVLIDFGDRAEVTTIASNAFNDTHNHFRVEEEETFKDFSPSSTAATSATSDDIFKYCSYCKRSFGVHVIVKHETICGKLFRKKHFNV